MSPIFLNMVWPAAYIAETFYHFWFLVFGTIIIEACIIHAFLKHSWKLSFIMSVVANGISALTGAFVMALLMIVWHAAVDTLLSKGTFNTVNWVVSYIVMCLGSVLIEMWCVRQVYKERSGRLFLSLLTGNVLTYLFIALVQISRW